MKINELRNADIINCSSFRDIPSDMPIDVKCDICGKEYIIYKKDIPGTIVCPACGTQRRVTIDGDVFTD